METAMMNSICRCCATEGVFKCVTIAYTWMGEEEIYADMLKECFDINLNLSESGEDGGICEVCITQLRNASNFKKQVLSTEEQLKKHAENKLFKPNIVKVEVTRNDDDSDDNMSAEEAYSGPEFEVPIKTETEESKPKKRTMATRASTSGAKKSKDDDAGETSTKRRPAENIKIKKEGHPVIDINNKKNTAKHDQPSLKLSNYRSNTIGEEFIKHRINFKEVTLCSNATPIRRYDDMGYMCCYCNDQFLEPAKLKNHTIETHKNDVDTFIRKIRMDKYFIKLDITALLCTICMQNFDSIELLLPHLKIQHQKIIYTELNNHMIPFKFNTDTLQCYICSKSFNKFKILQEHMHIHYRNYICDVCDAGYFNKFSLVSHKLSHDKGTFNCGYCSKTFDSKNKRRLHEKIHSDKAFRFKCTYCSETFSDYRKKEAHLVNLHGLKIPTPKCKSCDKIFPDRNKLHSHVKRVHLMYKPHKCSECDMSFYTGVQLKIHMVKHTGAKNHKCTICQKLFCRPDTLKEHMKIHDDVRRFKCEHCGQAFVQKCSWKGHMKSKHGEIV